MDANGDQDEETAIHYAGHHHSDDEKSDSSSIFGSLVGSNNRL